MSDNMNGDPIKQALKDFVATSNSGKYKSEDELMSKFPELSGYDRSVLKDFVATSNSGKYKSEDELFSKFPEFSSPVKKKDSLEPVGGGDVLGAAKKAAEARVASPSSPQQPKPVGTSVKSAATGLGSALPSPLKSESESGKKTPDFTKVGLEGEDVKTAKVLFENQDKDFIKRMFVSDASIKNADETISTHKMASANIDGKEIVFPTIVNVNGKLVDYSNDMDKAIDYAMANNEFIQFGSQEEASRFAEGGWKKLAQEYKNNPNTQPSIPKDATLASPIQPMSGDEAEVGYIEPPNIERVKTRNEFAGRESQARTALYDIQSGKTPSYVDASVLLELSNKGVFEDENVNDFQRKVQERQKIAVPKIEKLKADYIDNAQAKITEKLKKDPEYVSFNSALQSDIDAYAKSLVSAATTEIEQYSSVVKSQAELDAFYKQKAAEVDGAIKQYTDQKLSETSAQYKIFQEKAIKSLDNDIAIEASKIMESVMPGTEIIERTGLKSKLDEIVNDPNFEILPFDRKADLLKSMYITMGNNLAKKGLGTTENLLALKEQLDFNYLGKFYVNPDNTISAFALKQYAEQQIPEIDKKISELSKLYKDQQAAGNMAGGYYENPETGERMPTGEAMVKFQEAKDNLEKIKELPDDEQSGAFSDFMQGFMSTSAAQKTPFLASLLKVGKVGSLYNSAIAAKQTEADDALLTTEAMLQSYSDQTKDQRSIWYNAGVGTAESVPFMGEFMLTMGVGRGTVKGLEKIAEKKIKDYAESSTRKYLLKPLFETVGTLAQTTANPQQVAANTIERMVPEMQLAMSEDGDRIISEVDRNTGESFDEAFLKGFGKTWTEFFVERAGSALPFYTKGLSSKILPKSPDFVKRAFISFYMRKTGSNIGQAYTKLKNVGWDGLLAEFGEELAVMPMENFITGDYKDPAAGPYSSVLNGIIDPKTGNVDVDNLKTIAISVSAMTLPMIGVGMVVNSMPGAKTNVELFDINGNAYRVSIRNDIFRSVIGLYRKDPKALDKWISETMPGLNLGMDETFVVNKLVDALKNKSAQDRMPGTTISDADKKLIDEVEKALNKEQPVEVDTEESVNASKEGVLSEATPTTIDETNIVPSVASPENVEEIVVGEAALPIEKTESSVTSTDNIKPIINEQSVITNTTLAGLTEMENTIGGDNEIRTIDKDARNSEDFTYINYEGKKTTDKNHNITSLPKYRIFKGKNGKQYIQVTVAASDAVGRKGGASVIFEMTGDMTPEIEQAIFNLKANDYKDGNVIRKEGVSKLKNDLINIFTGKGASPVNSVPPVVEQTTVDDGGVTAPVVSPVADEANVVVPDATVPVQEVSEPVTEAAPKVASPARETKLQKRVREARERIQAKKTASEKKAELETIRAERAESRAKKEQISKLRTRTPKNVTEGVLRYFADGGKIGEAAFRKEVMDNDAEVKNRKGRIIANAKDISDNPNTDFNDLNTISMRIAEDMQVPAEIYDETVDEIMGELIIMPLSIQNRNDAEASLTESYEHELMQAEMSEAEFAEYEAEQKFLKGEARLDDYYSEYQLKEMSDAQKMADAVSIMEQTGSIPANTPTRRDKIKSEIDKIKDDIRKMSSGRLSSLPVDLFPKYVQLAAKYMELYGYDAYQFLAALKADGTDMGLPDDYLLSAHDKAVSEMKTSKFARTVQNAGKGISEKTKSEFSETGSTYTPITVRDTAKTAFEAWNEILERNNGDLEAAVWEAEQIVLRDDWGASPEQIGVLAGIVAEKMNELSKVEGLTIEQKNGYELRATNVFVKVRQRLTKAGQEASVVGKFMKEYFMAYPEAVTSFVYTSIDERNDTLVGVPGTEFTGTMMEIISEIMSTEAGMNAMMQLGIGKQAKIKKKYDKKQKAVSDAFDRVINDIDSFASGVSFAVPIPPSAIKRALKAMKKAIVSGLEVAKAVEIAVNSVKSEMKGVSFDADKAKAWFTGIADTILTDAEKNSDPEYVLSKMQEKLIKEQAAKVERAKKALEKYEATKIEREEKERIAKEAKAAEKAAKDADRQAKKEAADEAKAAKDEAKKAERLANAQRRKADAELERYNSALNNLKGNKLRQFAFNLAKNLPNGSGVINESMIVRAFQQANGGFQLTAKQQAELHQLAQVIANAYQSNRNALSASPNNSQFINSWIQTQYNAAQAAAKISQMLNPKRWVDMVNNAIVMNFMTFKTLGANPISNAIHKLYSAAYDDLLFSFVDVLYAPGQKSTFKERFKALFNIKPTVSWAKQLPDSVKRAWDIMKEGSPVEDADRYGASYTMKPLEAWQNISARASATNGFLPKVNSIAKDVYEGTFGVVPAFISRSLSSGDVVFRDPEAARVYQKWADDLGVDIDEFLTSEEFSEYRYYALEYAKRITFQQENVVSKVAGKAISKIRNKGIVDWLKVLFVKPIMPFFGTPINIKHEMLTMIPPISFSESLHHASVAKNKKLSDAERFFHAKLSQKMMRRAVGSIPLYYAASALLASGIISIIPGAIGDDDDAKERLNREAFEGKSGRIKIKNRNATIDGLKFGPLFDYLILVDAVNREYDRTGDEFNVILKGLVSTTKSTIDNTYLQGLKNVMEAATDPERNLQSLLINTYGSAYANILFPNIMSDLTRMMDKEKVLRQTKDESFVKSLYNKVIRERIGFIKSDYTDIEQLPSRVNVLGEPIRTDRDGVMDIFHYMFDMSRAQVYEPEKKAQLQIYKNFLKTDDKAWLYPIAPARVKFESESVKLDPVLRNEYQRILGQTLSKALGKKNLKSLDLKAFEKMKLKAQEESAKSFVEKYGDRLSELKKKQAEEKKRNPERDILK